VTQPFIAVALMHFFHAVLVAFVWIAHLLHPGDIPIAYELWHNLSEFGERHHHMQKN
jgi:hypothetical protein